MEIAGISEPPTSFEHEVPPEWLDELLDPAGWHDVLALYAGTVNLAVALTDTDGRLLSRCHNPQPTWRLAHGETAEVNGKCFFCLAPPEPCSAIADAIRMGRPVIVQDMAGLAHVAVPVSLDGQILGALLAGQAFNNYREPLRLQRVAKLYGVAPQRLWHEAVQQVPITRAALLVYGSLLMALGHGHLGRRYAVILNRRLTESSRTIGNSLREKEVMLQEIHHRVKNNLQMVSSLLNMQSGQLDSVTDAGTVAILHTSQQRIGAMAHIHDLLYNCQQIGEIDLGEYVRGLAELLISTFQSSAVRIRCHFDVVSVPIGIKTAIPCGLILNELVTNVFKYAYPNHEDGEIQVTVKLTPDERVSLTVSDRGVGLPEGLDWKNSDSLGFRIIDILTRQVGGTFQLNTECGFSFTLEFPRSKPDTRGGR